jgi:hypothetical protein
MAVLSFSQLEALWNQAAPNALKILAPVMAAIALAESSGNSQAVNPNDNNGTQSSYGLWQISNGTHSPPAPNWADPVENARLAVGKIQSQGLGAWGTYTSGAYKKFLNGAADTSGSIAPGGTVAAPPGSSTGSPLADVTSAVSQAGTLLGDAAKAMDWFFHLFKPGQGWRIAFGAASILAFYGGVRAWMAASGDSDAGPPAALPLAILLFSLSALAGFMTLRQWPTTSSGAPVKPGAYAVATVEGKPPAAGAAPASDAAAIEVGLGAILALWGASKAAQGLSGLGGLLAGLGALLGRGAAAGAGEVP